MSLRVKIILIFLVTTFVPFAVIATFFYVDIKQSIEKTSLDRVSTLATIQKARTEDLIKKYKLQLEEFESRLQIRQEVADYNRTKNPSLLSRITEELIEAKIGTGNIKDISILDLEGNMIASTNASKMGKRYSQEEFFVKGLEQDDTTVFYKENRKVYLYLTGPLSLAAEKIAVLAIEIKTDDLFALFRDGTGFGQTGVWALVKKDSNGDALVVVPSRLNTDPDAPLKTTVSKNNKTPGVLAISGVEKTFDNITNASGVHVISATRYIPGLEWGIVVNQNRSEVFAVSDSLANQLIFFLALLLLFVVFLSSIFAQLITHPIIALSKVATRIANGDLAAMATVNSMDEIGKLGGALNDMVLKLRLSYENLEDQVKQRTAELSAKVTELQEAKKSTLNILEDLTEEKTIKDQERAKAEAILASIGDGMIATDEAGKIVITNKGALDILGFRREELIGQWFPKIIEALDEKGQPIPQEARPIAESLLTGKKVSKIAYYVRSDKTKFPVAITVSPIILNGKPIGAIEVFRDITHEKDVDRMKTEFISLASHQLNDMDYYTEELAKKDKHTLPIKPIS